MPDTVLVPFDGTPLSERALRYAVENVPEARITTLYVIDPLQSVVDVEAGGLPVARDWYDAAHDHAAAVQTTATDLAADYGIDLETVTVVGKPAGEILEYAEAHDADLIVMGSHGRSGIERAILGSVTERVVRRSPVSVTVVR